MIVERFLQVDWIEIVDIHSSDCSGQGAWTNCGRIVRWVPGYLGRTKSLSFKRLTFRRNGTGKSLEGGR